LPSALFPSNSSTRSRTRARQSRHPAGAPVRPPPISFRRSQGDRPPGPLAAPA